MSDDFFCFTRQFFTDVQCIFYAPVSSIVKGRAIGSKDLGCDSWAGQIVTVSPRARHRCDVSSELCCPGASRGDGPRLETRHLDARHLGAASYGRKDI